MRQTGYSGQFLKPQATGKSFSISSTSLRFIQIKILGRG